MFTGTDDPRRHKVAPPRAEVPPFLNFAPLDNAADALTHSAERYRSAVLKAWPAGVSPALLQSVNEKLMHSEARLTLPEGLLRRPWYKHMIYAPGVYSGYGVKTLPGIREAIEQKKWAEADSEMVRVAAALDAESSLLNAAAAELEQAAK